MTEARERPAAARAGAPAPADAAGALGLRQVEAEVLPDGTLKRPEAAKFLGHKPQTLARWAVRGEGPPYFRLGKFVFYRLADLVAYKAKRAVERLPKQPDLL
jgi:predicted DNA-binding transcriptional regulator AlpA